MMNSPVAPPSSSTTSNMETMQSSSLYPVLGRIPLYYLAVRVTIPHDQWDDLHAVLKLDEVPEWVAFPHTGKEGNNPHFHLAIPTTAPGDPREADKFRKRLARKYRGNQAFSVKIMCNGILAAIQYMSKEGTHARIKGPNTSEWIEEAPMWEHREVQTSLDKKRKHPDYIPQITYANMFKVCARWRAQHDLKGDLTDVLDHMISSKEWQLSISVIKGGIPDLELQAFNDYVLPKWTVKHFHSRSLVYKPGYKTWS